MDHRPIGVFDSGLGGLTAVRELMQLLPREDIIYFGDTARVPYGVRSPETILKFARYNRDLRRELGALCGGVYSRYWRIAHGPDVNLKGAAAAVLMQQMCN